MKELSIEEKAKAYDEAFERARKINSGDGVPAPPDWTTCEVIFPQLKESEDESIRKKLISFVKNWDKDGIVSKYTSNTNDIKRILAWLEKQKATTSNKDIEKMRNAAINACKYMVNNFENSTKQYEDAIAWLKKQVEQKPIINVPSREVILAIWDLGNEWKELTNGSISTECGTQLDYIQKHWQESEYYLKAKQGEQKPAFEMITPEKSLGIDSDTYNKIVDDCIYGEQKPTDKVEPKFKIGDYIERKDGLGCHVKIIFVGGNVYGCEKLIHSEDESPFFELMFKNQDEFRVSFDFQQKPAWSEEDERILNTVIHELRYPGVNYYKKPIEENVKWLNGLKNRVQPQPKQEWSQDDEQYLLVCKNALAKYQTTDKWDATIISQWLENKLKSLKDRVLPQPRQEWSEEGEVKDDWEYIQDFIKKLGHFPNDSDELNVLTNYVLNKKQKSLKDRVQPKQEWNEEDEKYSSYICAALECYYRLREDRNNTNGQEDLDKARNWLYNKLKSLRPQSHWKPSDEQMTQLKKYCPDNRPLTSLYEQLKKLKE